MVIPAGVRERVGLDEGTPLVLYESDSGLVLMTRDQLRARLANELVGSQLVDELLADRRRHSASDDNGTTAILPGSKT